MSTKTNTWTNNPLNVPTIPPKRHPLTPSLQQLKNRILPSVIKHAHSAPFRVPINPKILTDYPTIISNPMDLATLTKRLSNGWYPDSTDCISDFKLMISNCLKYNHSCDNVSKLARSINALFGEMVDDLVEKPTVPGRSTRPERRQIREIKTNGINRPLELINKLTDSKNYAITESFMNPVDLSKYPDYSTLVATPTDLNKIKICAQNRQYDSVPDLVLDVRLLLSNCYVYNIPGSDLYDNGASLQKSFQKMLHISGFQGYGNCPYLKDKLLKIKMKLDALSVDISTLKRPNVCKSRIEVPPVKTKRPLTTTKKVMKDTKEVIKETKKKYSGAAKKDLIARLRKHIPSQEIASMKSMGLFGPPSRGLNIAKLDNSQLEVIEKHIDDYLAKDRTVKTNSPRSGQKRQIPSVMTNRSKVVKVKSTNDFMSKDDEDTLFYPENLDIPKTISWPKMVVSPPSAESKPSTNVQKSKQLITDVTRSGPKTSIKEPDSLIDSILNAPVVSRSGVATNENRRDWARLKAVDRDRRNAHNERFGVNLMEQYDLFSLMEDELIDYSLK